MRGMTLILREITFSSSEKYKNHIESIINREKTLNSSYKYRRKML